jgi:hypothetical protein
MNIMLIQDTYVHSQGIPERQLPGQLSHCFQLSPVPCLAQARLLLRHLVAQARLLDC